MFTYSNIYEYTEYDGCLVHVINEVPKEIINEMSINYKLKHVNRQSVFTYDFRLVPGL